MPKTRAAVSRDVKTEQILALAERRLRDGGYEALSIAGMARELGVAQNAIYWYFESKDKLFVATLQRMLEEIVSRKPSRETDVRERILWFTDEFQTLSRLRGAMSERARSSRPVAEFVAGLDELLSRLLSGALREHVAEEELPMAVETFRATVEGTFARALDDAQRRRLLGFALERLIGAAGAP
ncbi:MAG TPA: helix-turn-helix domain-containing protein [Solirubrobacteraceae bacterium]|jgi:AcrR family transcriptional regulator|nr:helix-turn-helix domain-containing protein [Solirubrobacteraceae bacterium]